MTIRGVRVPKGTTLMVMPQAIQLNPRVWGDDVDSFDPDRWTRGVVDAHAFAAFLHGPRQCIGRVFSMLEFKIILIEAVNRFAFDGLETDDRVVLINPSPLLRPKGGMKVRVSRLA